MTNPFGLFQGFGQMTRRDFEQTMQGPPPMRNRSTAPVSLAGATNTGPRGRSRSAPSQMPGLPPSANVPSQYPEGVSRGQGLPPSANVPSQYPEGVSRGASTFGAAPPKAGLATATAPAPIGRRPAAMEPPAQADLEKAYAVQNPGLKPVAAGAAPTGGGRMMAPLGSGRTEQLVQAAGNAGFKILPELRTDATSKAFDPANAQMFDAIDARDYGIAATPLSPETLASATASYRQNIAAPQETDRFAGLRDDIRQWAIANQNAQKGVDGKNIVDRFLEDQAAVARFSKPAGTPSGTPPVGAAQAQTGFAPETGELMNVPVATNSNVQSLAITPETMAAAMQGFQPQQGQQPALSSAPAPSVDAAKAYGGQLNLAQPLDILDQLQILREGHNLSRAFSGMGS